MSGKRGKYKSTLTREERALRASIAGHASWANTDDRAARGAAGAAGLMERFRRDVDPEGVLPPEERERRAAHLWRAHLARMSFLSSKARRCRSQPKPKDSTAEAVDAWLAKHGEREDDTG